MAQWTFQDYFLSFINRNRRYKLSGLLEIAWKVESIEADKVPFHQKSRLFDRKVNFSGQEADFSEEKMPLQKQYFILDFRPYINTYSYKYTTFFYFHCRVGN